MRLAEAKDGTVCKVLEIVGGRGATRNLKELGIYPGKKIKVLRNCGPVLVSVNGTQFVIGRGLAMKVIVDDEV